VTWEFTQNDKGGNPFAMVYVDIVDDGMTAYAEDGYYNGRIAREEALDLARAVMARFDPPAFAVGAHVRVVDGALCGCYGVVIGTVREDGYVILRCRDGVLLQPAKFLREGL
jgi:hypothetical protein